MAKKDKKTGAKKINISKPAATVLVIISCVVTVQITAFVLSYFRGTSAAKSVLARSKGNPKADLKITEYIDFQCPACARGAKTLHEVTEKYPAKIYLEIKYFPLDHSHQHAMVSALYAECTARQDKFWLFVDILLEKQGLWAQLTNAEPMFREIAQAVQVDLDQLNSCLVDKGVEEAIFKERDFGKSLGIKSTPTYFINGKMVVGTKSLQEELDKHLGVSVGVSGGTSH